MFIDEPKNFSLDGDGCDCGCGDEEKKGFVSMDNGDENAPQSFADEPEALLDEEPAAEDGGEEEIEGDGDAVEE